MSISITAPVIYKTCQSTEFSGWSKGHDDGREIANPMHSEGTSLDIGEKYGPSLHRVEHSKRIPSLNSAMGLLNSGKLKENIIKTSDSLSLTKKSPDFAKRVLFTTNH
jgi:hypothetical protein